MRRIAAGQARLTSPSVIRRHSQVLKEYRLLPLEVDIRAGLARDRHSSATAGSAISAADPQRMILAKEKSAEPDKPALSAVSNRGETRILERFPKRVLSPHFHPKECICIEPRVDPLGFRRRLLRWKSTKALNSASLRGSKAANSTQVAMSAVGQKQTSAHVRAMSAIPPKADIG